MEKLCSEAGYFGKLHKMNTAQFLGKQKKICLCKDCSKGSPGTLLNNSGGQSETGLEMEDTYSEPQLSEQHQTLELLLLLGC